MLCLNKLYLTGSVSIYQLALSQSISWLCLNLSDWLCLNLSAGSVSIYLTGSVSIYRLALSQSISWHCLNVSAGTVSIYQLALSQSISLSVSIGSTLRACLHHQLLGLKILGLVF